MNDETPLTEPTRRKLLNLTTAGAITGLAGCSGLIGSDADEPSDGDDGDTSDDGSDESDDGSNDGDDESDDSNDESESYPEPPFDQDCLSHDPENVEVEQFDDDDWRVVGGNGVQILAFDEFDDAKKTRDIIQSYEFDSHCFVGRPDPSMQYWLRDGGPASPDDASIEDEDCASFDRSAVEVIEDNGIWRLVADGLSLLSFESEENANRVVDVIDHYEFNRVCYVGRPNPPMSYWLSGGDE